MPLAWLVMGLTVMVVGGVLFGTLTPMPYDRVIPSVPILEGYRFISFEPTSFKDVAGNVLLYMPVGVVFWCFMHVVVRLRFTAAFAAAVSAILMSFCIEWAQVFIPGRYPSAIDICMNGMGACFGAISTAILTAITRKLFNRAVEREREIITRGHLAADAVSFATSRSQRVPHAHAATPSSGVLL